MNLLAIDTSTQRLIVALVQVTGDPGCDRQVRELSEVVDVAVNRHAEVLSAAIQRALVESTLTPGELSGVVVGLGPGPFTGLRVGIVSAAAFADAVALPVWGVPSHAAIADGRRRALVISDARRREVYFSAYDGAAQQSVAGVESLGALSAASFAHELELVVHPGVAQYAEDFDKFGVPVEVGYPGGESLVRAALRSGVLGAPSSALTPMYLRAPDAAHPRERPALNLVLPDGQ